MKKAVIVLLFLVICIGGCVSKEKPKVGSSEVDLGSPYQIDPDEIGFLIDSHIDVPIENPRDDKIKIEILEAKMVINYRNGRNEILTGTANSLTIPPKEERDLTVTFNEIPVRYELNSNPLRLTPLVNSYEVTVRYKATTKVFFGLIPWSKKGEYNKVVELEEKRIDKGKFLSLG